MKNTKQISQRLFVRALGWRHQTTRTFARFLAAIVAFSTLFTLGAVESPASSNITLERRLPAFAGRHVYRPYEDLSNNMAPLSPLPATEKESFMRESQGFLVEELDGKIIEEQNTNTAYNPASAVKVLTAYTTIKQFGPDFKFETKLLIDGSTDGNSFEGDIYLEGRDPFFDTARLQEIFAEFKTRGINTVDASFFVSPDFKFAGQAPGQKSAKAIRNLFGAGRRKRARALRTAGVRVTLKVAEVKIAPPGAELLKEIRSPTVLALLKDMLSRSDNQMAAIFGQEVGGPQAVARVCRTDFGVSNESLSIATTSGLGVNRVSPKAMIAALRGFKKLLAGYKLNLRDALPIAGIDQGTIFKRFEGSELKDVLVGKTGTLKQTDNGASVLVGEMSTLLRGHILFVVFQRGRNTRQLRQSQNLFLEHVLSESGGPGSKYSG